MTKPVALMDHVEQVSLVEPGYEGAVLAVKDDHTLWGVGTLGYLGFPKGDSDCFSATPVKLMDNVESVSAGAFGAMVLKQDGSLWYLGSPTEGQLGDGTYYTDTADRPAGTYHVMDDVKMVTSGFYRFAALKNDGSVWVWGADGYCVNNGLFTKSEVPLSTMEQKATRFQMVDLMDRAVPDSEMKPVNTVPDGGVPDLKESDPYGDVVYRWYRAGITEGDQSGRFNGSSQISRSEVATLLCRLAGLTPRV